MPGDQVNGLTDGRLNKSNQNIRCIEFTDVGTNGWTDAISIAPAMRCGGVAGGAKKHNCSKKN